MIQTLNVQLSNARIEHQQLILEHSHAITTGILPQPQNENEKLVREERKNFIRACPAEGCRGFLSARWKCGLCEKYTCNECHALKEQDKEHVCNPDELATAKLLNKDTKPCPKCASMIFKIDGCDQMWCIECKTAFSWKTGRIETRIHNPHYFEYLRRTNNQQTLENLNQQVQRDFNCGRHCFLNYDFINQLERKFRNIYNNADKRLVLRHISGICNALNHLEYNEKRSKFDTDENELNKERLRIRRMYLKNQYTKEDAKSALVRIHKDYDKRKEYCDLLDMYLQTLDDILRRFDGALSNFQNVLNEDVFDIRSHIQTNKFYESSIMKEISAITDYVNENMQQISEAYGNVCYVLFDLSKYNEWQWFDKDRKLIVPLHKYNNYINNTDNTKSTEQPHLNHY